MFTLFLVITVRSPLEIHIIYVFDFDMVDIKCDAFQCFFNILSDRKYWEKMTRRKQKQFIWRE